MAASGSWGDFINAASRNYGLGLQRQQQYQAIQDDRRNKADLRDIAAEMKGTEVELPGAQTAVPTGEAPQMSPVAPTAPAIPTVGGDNSVPQMSPVATPNPMGQPILDGEPTAVGYKPPRRYTRVDWDRVRDIKADLYARQGDTESLLALDDNIAKMQHDRTMRNMKEAVRLWQSDPQAAIKALYEANQYVPNGKNVGFSMKNGQLYGFNFDEETGKFEAGQKVDYEDVIRYTEFLSDPMAFRRMVEQEKIERQERKLERDHKMGQLDYYQKMVQLRKQQDAAMLQLKQESNAIQAKGTEAQAFASNVQGLKTLDSIFGSDFTKQGWETPEEAATYRTAVTARLDKTLANPDLLTPLQSMAMLPELGGQGGLALHTLGSSLANHMRKTDGVPVNAIPGIAATLLIDEWANSLGKGEEVKMDEEMTALLNSRDKNDVISMGLDPENPKLMLLKVGEHVVRVPGEAMPLRYQKELVKIAQAQEQKNAAKVEGGQSEPTAGEQTTAVDAPTGRPGHPAWTEAIRGVVDNYSQRRADSALMQEEALRRAMGGG
jgi:hypothetical protein